MELIEVQSGAYLGEDDIVRFEDGYGRQSIMDPTLTSSTTTPMSPATPNVLWASPAHSGDRGAGFIGGVVRRLLGESDAIVFNLDKMGTRVISPLRPF